MLKSMLVRDYMTTDHLAFTPDMDVLKAIHQLLAHQLTGAPVLGSDGTLVGFFSERDALKAGLNASYYEQPGGPVSQFMSPNAESLDANSSMADAIEMFLAHHYHCYPVLSGRRVVGQLSRRDALKALEKLW